MFIPWRGTPHLPGPRRLLQASRSWHVSGYTTTGLVAHSGVLESYKHVPQVREGSWYLPELRNSELGVSQLPSVR